MLEIKQITLYGRHIVLRPPSINDIEGLTLAAKDGRYGIIVFLNFQNLMKFLYIYKGWWSCKKMVLFCHL
ncbi:MAG: hypothetical protein MRJ93_08000 [Nitrososphaeraceae archaeon]|nr:hypothetical protein [Nitrososphaeraceae archaeon]